MSSTAEVMNITTKTTKADLEREVRRLASLANDNHNELQSFQQRVYEVALEQKQDNDWCDEGFAKAMKELGLKAPAQYRILTIRVPLDLLDPKGPTDYDLADLDSIEDKDVYEAVVDALNTGYGDGYEGHTYTVETVEDAPETLFREKARVGSRYGAGGYYNGI